MTKFKVGDKVMCVKNLKAFKKITSRVDIRGHGWKKDFIFVIEEITCPSGANIYWPKYHGGVYEPFLELASIFRLGDKVEIKDTYVQSKIIRFLRDKIILEGGLEVSSEKVRLLSRKQLI